MEDSLLPNKYRLVILHIVTVVEAPLHLDAEDFMGPLVLRFAHMLESSYLVNYEKKGTRDPLVAK